MSVPGARVFVAFAMSILWPLSLTAADAGSAVVHSSGGLYVNGAEAADSTAIFKGDTIETKPGFVANLDTTGSSILIQGESIVKFEGDFVTLEHGSVSVGTATEFSVHVNCLEVKPVALDRTQYDVTDLSGKVDVAAQKKDVTIKQGGRVGKVSKDDNPGQSNVVHEGQQDTRYEASACGAADSPRSATSSLNTKWLEIGGGGGGAALLCILLCKGKGSSSVSPSNP